jgi:hypothetical protein
MGCSASKKKRPYFALQFRGRIQLMLLISHVFFPLFKYYGHGGNEFDSLTLKLFFLRSVKVCITRGYFGEIRNTNTGKGEYKSVLGKVNVME